MTPIGTELDGLVLQRVQDAYLAGKIRKTKDCLSDMDKAELFEADVEKVIMDADAIEKAMPQPASGRAIRTIPTMSSMAPAPKGSRSTVRFAATIIRRPVPLSNGSSPRSRANRGLNYDLHQLF
jgi:hypothetical protein